MAGPELFVITEFDCISVCNFYGTPFQEDQKLRNINWFAKETFNNKKKHFQKQIIQSINL